MSEIYVDVITSLLLMQAAMEISVTVAVGDVSAARFLRRAALQWSGPGGSPSENLCSMFRLSQRSENLNMLDNSQANRIN